MKSFYAIGLVLAGVFALAGETYAAPRHVSLASLDENARELFQDSMELDAQCWDDKVKLVHNPSATAEGLAEGHYMVRESSWYALGLLFRDGAGDRQRAAAILDAVLKQQYVTPGPKWYGTYKRTPEEPDPTTNPVIWRGYDPNWRVFIGTTFAMILTEYPERISPELAQRMYAAIDRSIEGEMHEGRLVPSYSNIALMYGLLWDFAAVHDKRADWQKQSAEWTESVYKLFKQYDAFFEYNSPTYYGVDLYGLALWRDYGSTERMRAMGSEMEAKLWEDIADFYQPELRNVSGPYDRSYGMDMESYVSLVGVWMRTVMDAQKAPLPPIAVKTDHVADAWFVPQFVILGTQIPAGAMAKMKTFEGEHLLRKQITEQRVATAWIGKDVIFGGEATSKTKDAGPSSQFHPATVQWRTPSGEIGWVQLIETPMVDAIADKDGLTISTQGTVRFRVHARGLAQEKIAAGGWDLPGLRVGVTADAKSFRVEKVESGFDVTYVGITGMRLGIKSVW
jgi:hypothetical protein